MNQEPRDLLDTDFYVFKEQTMWICAWKYFDLVTQGKTKKEACERMIRTIAAQAIWDARDGRLKTFGSARKPPAKVLKDWQRRHLQTHGN